MYKFKALEILVFYFFLIPSAHPHLWPHALESLRHRTLSSLQNLICKIAPNFTNFRQTLLLAVFNILFFTSDHRKTEEKIKSYYAFKEIKIQSLANLFSLWFCNIVFDEKRWFIKRREIQAYKILKMPELVTRFPAGVYTCNIARGLWWNVVQWWTNMRFGTRCIFITWGSPSRLLHCCIGASKPKPHPSFDWRHSIDYKYIPNHFLPVITSRYKHVLNIGLLCSRFAIKGVAAGN